ncbi:MAG: hypothetical protein ABSD98_18390 [Candidatus Korobacteraceae bacterium]|jgi:hypothetical protein
MRNAVRQKVQRAINRAFEKHKKAQEESPDTSNIVNRPSEGKVRHSALIISRSALIGSVFIQWLRLMGAVSFIWSAGLGYVLVILALAEIWFEPMFNRRFLRPILTLLVVSVCLWFSLKVVFVPAPLQINAVCHSGHYPKGTEYNGINWEPYFSDLRVVIANRSDSDYDDMDIELRPDVYIAAIRQVDDTPNVSFVAVRTNVTSVAVFQPNPADSNTVIPIPVNPNGDTPAYRVRCLKLPAQSFIELVIATINFDGMELDPKGHRTNNWRGPIRPPTMLLIKGHYNGFMRIRNINTTVKVVNYPAAATGK